MSKITINSVGMKIHDLIDACMEVYPDRSTVVRACSELEQEIDGFVRKTVYDLSPDNRAFITQEISYQMEGVVNGRIHEEVDAYMEKNNPVNTPTVNAITDVSRENENNEVLTAALERFVDNLNRSDMAQDIQKNAIAFICKVEHAILDGQGRGNDHGLSIVEIKKIASMLKGDDE